MATFGNSGTFNFNDVGGLGPYPSTPPVFQIRVLRKLVGSSLSSVGNLVFLSFGSSLLAQVVLAFSQLFPLVQDPRYPFQTVGKT